MGYISKGKGLMSFVDGKAIAFATEHSLTVSGAILEERTKDDGRFPSGEPDGYDWSADCSSIVGLHPEGDVVVSVVDLARQMLSLQPVDLVMDSVANPTGVVPSMGWTPSGNADAYPTKSGSAWIESLSITAGASGYASASVSFRGDGDLTDVSASAASSTESQES